MRLLLFLLLLIVCIPAYASPVVIWDAACTGNAYSLGSLACLGSVNAGGTGAYGATPFGTTAGMIPYASSTGALTSTDGSSIGLCFDANQPTGALVINPPSTGWCTETSGTPTLYVNQAASNTGMAINSDGTYDPSFQIWEAGTSYARIGIAVNAGNGTPRTAQYGIYFRTLNNGGAENIAFTASGGNTTAMLISTSASPHFDDVVTFDGHLKFVSNDNSATAPTAAPAAGAGTGATCTIAHAADTAGIITLTTTAVSPASGDQCDVTFNQSFGVAPVCVITPAAATAASLVVLSQVYVTSTTGKVSINFGGTDATGHVYVLNYYCVETQ